MANIEYKGDVVNSVLEQINGVSRTIPSLSTSLRNATNYIISSRGFNQYIGGISSDTFSSSVEKCGEAIGQFVREIKQKQITILAYSKDKEAINTFLDSLSRKEFDTLDLGEIKEYIGLDRKAGNLLKGVGATAATAGIGLAEGVADFIETGADLVTLGTTLFKSIFTKEYDLLTGNDITTKMWEETKARVSEKKAESIFNRFYDNSELGQYIRENAKGFETVRGIGKGLGNTVGVIGLTALTGGLGAGSISPGALALTGGAFGFSNGTEEAWADGAGIGKGLAYGAASGTWEGLQWFAGAKINQIGGLGDRIAKGIFKGAAKGVGTRIALDTVDSGLEGFVRPGLNMIYKDFGKGSFVDRYKTAFSEAGGWQNVGMSAAMGAIGSAVGEYTGARRLLKEAKKAEAEFVFKDGVVEQPVLPPGEDTLLLPEHISGKNLLEEPEIELLGESVPTKNLLDNGEIHVKGHLLSDGVAGEEATNIFRSDIPATLSKMQEPLMLPGEVELNLGKRVIDDRLQDNIVRYKITGDSVPSLMKDSALESAQEGKVFRSLLSESEQEVLERIEKNCGVKITSIGDTLIPGSNIPIQSVIDVDGTKYYINGNLKPNGKVDGGSKHIWEQVAMTLKTEDDFYPEKVNTFFSENNIKSTYEELFTKYGGDEEKIIDDVKNKLRGFYKRKNNISGHLTPEQASIAVYGSGIFEQKVPLDGLKTNLSIAGMDVGDLSKYSIEELQRLNGEATYRIYTQGLKKYNSDILAKDVVSVKPLDKSGVPTWVNAVDDGKEYLMEIITRDNKPGEIGDKQLFHMIHKSGAITMEQSARQQGAKNVFDAIRNEKLDYNIMNLAIRSQDSVLPPTYQEFMLSPQKTQMIRSIIDDLSTRSFGTQSVITNPTYQGYAYDSVRRIMKNPDLSNLIEKVIKIRYNGTEKAYQKALKELSSSLEESFKRGV